ncbi:uncharacterized protein JCM15063_002239 [Sporobolomyces koalae]|uniref:uncharacterized protein n=1 Tax=Sporobolomyces koalae TaxID=500713 RepID=UPI00317B5EED
MTRLQLYALAGSKKHDLASLDPHSLVAASYLQLLQPGEWDLVQCSDPGMSPSGSLPFLKHGLDTFTGSAILHYLAQLDPSPVASTTADSRAFHALLDTTVLPLVLHSLYSLPQNWSFVRQLLIPHLPFPASFYRPAQLRESAQELVTSLHPDWWGLGGEAEKEEEMNKQRKRALLDTGVEGLKERREEARKEGKERMKKTFGEGKIVSAARRVFVSLETTLASSSTPFFFSSPTATPLDAHLSSLLSLLLFLPLPTPLLADLINASFPRLWAHTALLRRTLWSRESVPLPRVVSRSSTPITRVVRDLFPSMSFLNAFGLGSPSMNRLTKSGKPLSSASTPLSKSQLEFNRNRRRFLAVLAVGIIGWALGTGALPLPGKLGKLLGRHARRVGMGQEEEAEEWEGDEDDEEEDQDEIEI